MTKTKEKKEYISMPEINTDEELELFLKEVDSKLEMVPLTYDYAFKSIFSDNALELKDLIFACVPLPVSQGESTFVLNDTYMTKENKNEKQNILDMLASINGNIVINTEMSRSHFDDSFDRNVMYVCRGYARSNEIGEGYKLLKEKIFIQFSLNAYPKGYKYTKDDIYLTGKRTNHIYSNKLVIHTRVLDHFRQKYYNGHRDKETVWLTTLTAKNFSELNQILENIMDLARRKKFIERVINMSQDGFTLSGWKKEEFDELERYNCINRERAEADSEARDDEKESIAKNLLSIGKLSIDEIKNATGLSKRQINKLASNL